MIAETIEGDNELRAKRDLLLTINGVGEILASIVLAELPGAGDLALGLIPIRKNEVVWHVDEIGLIGMSSNRGCRASVYYC